MGEGKEGRTEGGKWGGGGEQIKDTKITGTCLLRPTLRITLLSPDDERSVPPVPLSICSGTLCGKNIVFMAFFFFLKERESIGASRGGEEESQHTFR